MKKKWICLLLVALLLCGAVTACAPAETSSKYETTVKSLMAVVSVDELLENDPTVIRGAVSGIEKAIDVNKVTSAGFVDRMVHTYYNVDVKETFMGTETKKVTIAEKGGETETQIVKVDGVIQPQKGEERYFFLWKDGLHHYSFPIQDGKVRVQRTELPELFEKDAKDVSQKNISVEEFETILRAKIAAKKN